MSPDPSAARSRTLDAAGVSLGVRVFDPPAEPRGLIVAVHGGTYDSAYYDLGEGSLTVLGPADGFRVVALDRPGYGDSAGVAPERLTFAEQTAILAAAIDWLAAENPGLPIVVVGHSIGGMLALRAAAATAVPVAGVEVSGLGELWQPGIHEMWGSLAGDAPAVELPPEAHAGVMLGPRDTQAADSVERDGALLRAMPMPELIDVLTWSDQLPEVGAALTVPVSLTLAEHDNIWRSDDDAQQALAGHFTQSPGVRVSLFAGAGHSIELHANAADYVRRQLDFAADCLA